MNNSTKKLLGVGEKVIVGKAVGTAISLVATQLKLPGWAKTLLFVLAPILGHLADQAIAQRRVTA